MNAEFFDAVADIEKEKGIPREYMYEKIRQAMLTAFRKDTPDCEDNVEVILDEAKKKIEMVVKKTVVGAGHAEKAQVAMMVRVLLPKSELKSADAADALALAICHARSATSLLRRADPQVKETV